MSRILVLCALATLLLPRSARGGDVLWTAVSPGTPRALRATLDSVVIVAGDSALAAIDADRGRIRWSRPDLAATAPGQLALIASASLLLVETAAHEKTPARVEAIETATGRSRWTSDSLDVPWARGEWLLPERDLLVLLCSANPNDTASWSVTAIDLSSGTVRWRAADWFMQNPKIVRVRAREGQGPWGLEPLRPPLLDSDTTMVIYVSADGPLQVDLRTGRPRWKADDPATRFWHLPDPNEFLLPMLEKDGVLWVPNGKRLEALDAMDGRSRGRRSRIPRRMPGLLEMYARYEEERVTRMEWTARGLLISGSNFMTLLDPRSGKRLWQRPVTFKECPAPWALVGDSIYLAAEKFLTRIDLATGGWRDLTPLRFKSGEQPFELSLVPGGVWVRSAQNLALFDLSGRAIYHVHRPAPEKVPGLIAGLFNAMAVTVVLGVYVPGGLDALTDPVFLPPRMDHRVAKAQERSQRFTHLLCDFEDGTGNGLVKIANADGREVDRLVLGKHVPLYALDPLEDRVYVVSREGRVTAHRF